MNFEEVLKQIKAQEEIDLTNNLLAGLPIVADKDNWTLFAKRAVVAVNYNKSYQAVLVLKSLAGLLPAAADDTRREYEQILAWFSYAALDDLPDAEVDIFFKERDIGLFLKEPLFFDLMNKIKLWLLAKPIDDRDAWRERIYNALRQNSHGLTEAFIIENERGSVANWIKEYDKTVGFALAETLDRIEFENQSSIAAHLSQADKNLLKRLLDFYEYIKLSTFSIQGFEEDFAVDTGGQFHLLSAGKDLLAPTGAVVNPKANPLVPAVAPTNKILPPLPEIIRTAQAQLMSTNGDAPKVIAELQKNLGAGQTLGVLASLLLLAQLRRLDDVLTDAPAFRAFVAQDLEKSGQAVQQEGLNAQPNAPQFLARFLKIILQDNLRLNSGEALAFGKRLGELMALEGEAFRQLVITDERGQAKWNI